MKSGYSLCALKGSHPEWLGLERGEAGMCRCFARPPSFPAPEILRAAGARGMVQVCVCVRGGSGQSARRDFLRRSLSLCLSP